MQKSKQEITRIVRMADYLPIVSSTLKCARCIIMCDFRETYFLSYSKRKFHNRHNNLVISVYSDSILWFNFGIDR